MDSDVTDYYDQVNKVFSSAAPNYDVKIGSNFVNLIIRDQEMRHIFAHYKEGFRVLEIGCGTGEEARRLIEKTGCKVTCIDIAEGMIKHATAKMSRLGLSGNFDAVRLPASALSTLGKKFDVIYSFNGALNNEPKISSFFQSLDDSLSDGGYFIASFRNRVSLGELILGFLQMNFGKMKTRLKGTVEVDVGNGKIISHYFFNREFLNLIPDTLKVVEIRGLALFLLPSLYDKIVSDRVKKIISRVENLFSLFPVLRNLGDETLFVFQKAQ